MTDRSSPKDALNRKIIRLLQDDGRMPFKDIAKYLDVSEGTVRNRVKLMKEANLLKIVALADPLEIRYKTDAMIGVKVSNLANSKAVANRLSELPEVVYLVCVSGRYDLLVEVVCDSNLGFQEFLEHHCFGNTDINQFEVMTTIEMFKNQFLLKRQTI